MDNLTAQLKTSLRIDGNEEDELLNAYVLAAKVFVKNAVTNDPKFIVSNNVEVYNLYTMAVLALAGAYYTYRIALVDTQTYPIDLTLNSIISQLRGVYAFSKYGGENDDQEATV